MNAQQEIRRWLPAAATLFLCALGAVGAAWLIGGPVIPASTLKDLRGLTHEEVRRILGNPCEDSSTHCWIYDRRPTQGWVEIQFNVEGRVDGVNDEQACPGLWGPSGSWSADSPDR